VPTRSGSRGVADANRLGYFDQAHFARDFKAIVGSPPNQYARSVAPLGLSPQRIVSVPRMPALAWPGIVQMNV
jgi:AraC-like DNA-binding protein